MSKTTYYWDEYYSFDNAHYFSSSTPDRVKLYDSDLLVYNEWMPVEKLKAQYVVQPEEAIYHDSFSYVKACVLHQKTFILLLNLVEAVFFPGVMTKWSGFVINIICFILSQLVLFAIARRITKDEMLSVMATALWGFCGMAASLVCFVRLYMFVTLLITLYIYCHVRMIQDDGPIKTLGWIAISATAIYLSLHNAPQVACFAAAMAVMTVVLLVKNRKWIQAAEYILVYGAGAFYYLVFQFNIMDIFVNGANSGYMARDYSIGFLLTMTPLSFFQEVLRVIRFVGSYLFGSMLFAFICMIMLIVDSKKTKGEKHLLPGDQDLKKGLIAAVLASIILEMLVGMTHERYYAHVFPIGAVLVVMLLTEKYAVLAGRRKSMLRMLSILVCITTITFAAQQVNYIYPSHRADLKTIQSVKGVDNIVFDEWKWDPVIYECVAQADENTNILVTDSSSITEDMCPDQVLVWLYRGNEPYDCLKDMGYTGFDKLGTLENATVYYAYKE